MAVRRLHASAPAGLLAAAALTFAVPSRAADDPLRLRELHYRTNLLERHVSPEGIVLYRVNPSRIAREVREGRYPLLADAPTFTGQWATGACLRAGYSRGAAREQALDDASRALGGLEALSAVTGVPGLYARTLRRAPPPSGAPGRWFRGRRRGSAYFWRGDVSMDQYANGVLPALWACRALFPERTRRAAVALADHLLANGLHLVDPDGRPTRFGDLSPRAGAGLNSIAMLTGYAAFSLAARLDPAPVYRRERDRLRDRERVPARARVTNLRFFGRAKRSNDLMAWDLLRVLVPLARETRDPALGDLRHALFSTWLRVRADGNAYFAILFCRIEPESCDGSALRAARDQLEHFPLTRLRARVEPGLERLPRAWLPDRRGRRRARDPVPIGLRAPSSFEWKSDPYRLVQGVAPHTEYSGLDFLVAYWAYRSLPRVRGEEPLR
ncbi:MAG: hypothetical protein ACE5IL_13045 [Myxococcota bacterium]